MLEKDVHSICNVAGIDPKVSGPWNPFGLKTRSRNSGPELSWL